MRKTVSRSTCANRSATVAFWCVGYWPSVARAIQLLTNCRLWFFESAVVKDLAYEAGVAVVPDLIR